MSAIQIDCVLSKSLAFLQILFKILYLKLCIQNIARTKSAKLKILFAVAEVKHRHVYKIWENV